jgi:thioredoxin 1
MLPANELVFNEALNTLKPLVTMISAPWCAPCRMLKPTVEKLEQEYKDRVNFLVINSDDYYELCSTLQVSAIPTLIYINKAKIMDRHNGVQSENSIRLKIEDLLK